MPSTSESHIVITAAAAAAHPAGVRLDENGHPILDEHGEPVYDQEEES